MLGFDENNQTTGQQSISPKRGSILFATSNNYPQQQQQQQQSFPSRMDSRSPARTSSLQSSHGEYSPTLQHIQIQKFPSNNSGSPGSHGRRSSVQHVSSNSSVSSNSNRSVGSHSTGSTNKNCPKKKDVNNINISNSTDNNDIITNTDNSRKNNGNDSDINDNNSSVNVSTDGNVNGHSPRRQSMIPVLHAHHDNSSTPHTLTPAHHSPSQLLSKAHQLLSQNSQQFSEGGEIENRPTRSSLSSLGFGAGIETGSESESESGYKQGQIDTVRKIEGQESGKRNEQEQGQGQGQGGKHTPRRGSIIPLSINHSSSSSLAGTDKGLERGAGRDRESRVRTGSEKGTGLRTGLGTGLGTGSGTGTGLEKQRDDGAPASSQGSPPRRQSLIPLYDSAGESSYSYYQSQSQSRSPTSTSTTPFNKPLASTQNENQGTNDNKSSDLRNAGQGELTENSSKFPNKTFIPNFDNQFNKEDKYKDRDEERNEDIDGIRSSRSTIKPFQNISIMTDVCPWEWEKREGREEGTRDIINSEQTKNDMSFDIIFK